MEQSNNCVIIAAAGSGKTTFIVEQAISLPEQKTLIVTYTNENLNEIRKAIINKLGFIPQQIKIQSWFSFLLQDCARPYQNFLYEKKRIDSIKFVEGRSTSYIKKSNIDKYFFYNSDLIYTDKIAEFICECNKASKGLVFERLEKIYDYIFIDEVQDLGGYDLEIIKLLFNSKIRTVLVGDNRQTTYRTNNSPKYSKYRGENILDFFIELEKSEICTIEYRNECYRSVQEICDFADSLYPHMPKTNSLNGKKTEHNGLFVIKAEDIEKYLKKFDPVVLRHDKRSSVKANIVMNFGQAKGLTFDRVLIIPTKPIKKYLITGTMELSEESKSKFYVAVTRAKYSVGFIMDEDITIKGFVPYKF